MISVKANLAWGDAPFPTGTVYGGVHLTLTGSQPGNLYSATAAQGDTTLQIDNVAPDTYAVSAQNVDTNGAALGGPISTSNLVVTAPGGTVTISVLRSFNVFQANS